MSDTLYFALNPRMRKFLKRLRLFPPLTQGGGCNGPDDNDDEREVQSRVRRAIDDCMVVKLRVVDFADYDIPGGMLDQLKYLELPLSEAERDAAFGQKGRLDVRFEYTGGGSGAIMIDPEWRLFSDFASWERRLSDLEAQGQTFICELAEWASKGPWWSRRLDPKTRAWLLRGAPAND